MIKRTMLALALATVAAAGAYAQTPAAGSAPNRPYEAVANWLKPVDAPRLLYPVGVFAETPDRVFIGNKGTVPPPGDLHGFDPKYPGARIDHQLFIVDHNGKLVEEWSQWSELFGSLHKIKINPYDPEKHIWAIDRVSQQLLEFTHDGKTLVKAIGERGVAGADDKHFGRPTDMAWLPDGTFYVSDGYDNSRVVKFDRNGRFIKAWGTLGSAPGQFHEPHSIAVDAKGQVYVADRLNKRIQIFDGDGKFLQQWTDFESPAVVMVAMDQSVWVLDNARARLERYSPQGKLLSFWGAKGEFPGAMFDPHDFSVGADGAVYVSNGHAHRVDKYVPMPGADKSLLVGQPYFAQSKSGTKR